MGGGGSAPAPPDPAATAAAQTATNEATARTTANLNRVNQVGPDGKITYTQDPRAAGWLDQRVREDQQAHIDQGKTWNEGDARKYFETQAGGNPYADKYTMTTELSPENQRLYDLSKQAQTTYGEAANRQLSSVSGMLSTPFNGARFQDGTELARMGTENTLSGVQRVANQAFVDQNANQSNAASGWSAVGANRLQGMAGQPVNTDYNSVRQGAIDAANSRLQPQFKQQEDELRTRLLNSGIPEGSEQWNRAYTQMNQSQNDSRQQTILNAENLAGQSISQTSALRQIPIQEQLQALQGYGMSGQEATRAFGQAAQGRQIPFQEAQMMAQLYGQQGNQNSQALQMALAQRAQPTNEAAALLTGQQVGVPQLQQTPGAQVAPTDYIGLMGQNYQGQMNAYGQKVGSGNAAMGAAASMVGTAATAAAIAY